MKRLIVTGATGYLGKHFFQGLQGMFEVYGLVRRPTENNNHFLIDIDTSDPLFIDRVITDIQPDIILHNAAFVDLTDSQAVFDELFTSNIELTRNYLRAAAKLKKTHFLNFDTYSSYCYDGTTTHQNMYSASKNVCREYLNFFSKLSNIKATNLVIYDVFGEDDDRQTKVYNKVINAIKGEEIIDLTKGDQEINFVHVSDVISAVKKAIMDPRDENTVFGVSGPETLPLKRHFTRILNDERMGGLLNFGGYVDSRQRPKKIMREFKTPEGYEARVRFSDWIAEICNV